MHPEYETCSWMVWNNIMQTFCTINITEWQWFIYLAVFIELGCNLTISEARQNESVAPVGHYVQKSMQPGGFKLLLGNGIAKHFTWDVECYFFTLSDNGPQSKRSRETDSSHPPELRIWSSFCFDLFCPSRKTFENMWNTILADGWWLYPVVCCYRQGK